MKKKRIAVILAAVMMAGAFSGCNSKKEEAKLGNTDINFGDYKDSEDIPSWDGSELSLTVWQDTNSPNAYQRMAQSPDDAVAPEIKRITGVQFNPDESFDNAGNSFDAKITQIVASGDFPDIAFSLPELSELVKTNRLYDLTPYVEKYCPNIMKMMGPDTVFKSVWESQKENLGGLYALAIGENKGLVRKMVSEDKTYDLTEDQINSICGPSLSPYGYVYIREDILKKLYPNAHTSDELEEIYNKNGSFTKEEIFDVPLESTQDFIDMLYKIKSMNLTDDGKQVYTMYTHNGSDNWNALTTGGGAIFGYRTQYFDYIDLQTGKAGYTFKQPWFKDVLKQYNQLVRDGIVPSENLMDTAQTHKEKLSSARYAVSIAEAEPDVSGLGGKYKYRRVYFKYNRKDNKFLNTGTGADALKKVSFFKDSLSENELIQALRTFDLIASLPGQKLTYWGAKSAGLYTETEDGRLQYKDENLKNQMLNRNKYGTELIEKYGLSQGAWPGYCVVEASMYRPEAFYEKQGSWVTYFNPAYIHGEGIDRPSGASVDIYNSLYTANIPKAKTFWQARNAFEDSLLQIFASASDAEFEQRYSDMIALAERNGLTDETLAEFQKEFDKANASYKEEQQAFAAEMKERFGEE